MRIRSILLVLAAAMPMVAGAASTADLAALIRDGERAAALAAVRDGADVNAPQGDGTTPLHWAVYKVDVDLTRELLKHGANPNVKNALGSTPLAEAAKRPIRAVKLLVRRVPT
jgi:ankyrin repeat protein